jgi:hypothetical protein
MAIKDIQVVETIKEGRSIYRNPSVSAATAAVPANDKDPINDKDNCWVPHGDQPAKRLNPAQEKTLERLMAPGS